MLTLATEPHELWSARLRVLTDRRCASELDFTLFISDGTSRSENTRDRTAKDWGTSRRLGSIRQPPFSHAQPADV